MADYSDCIRNLRETASVLDDVADKRHDKRAELREVVDFLEATVTRLGKGQGSQRTYITKRRSSSLHEPI